MYYNENRGNEPRDRRKNQGGIEVKIAMACDHGGLRLKNVLKEDLEKML